MEQESMTYEQSKQASSEYIQRLLAGCTVKEPAIDDYPGYGDALHALYKASKYGPVALNRAWSALVYAEPALGDLLPPAENYYSQSIEESPDLLETLDTFAYDESGQGEAFYALYHDRLRYIPGAGWFIWTGHRWQRDDREAIVQYAIAAARMRQKAARSRQTTHDDPEIQKQLEAAQAKALRFAESAANYTRIKNSIMIGKTVPQLITSHKAFDKQPHLMGVKNGVVDLQTGHLLAATQDQYITHTTAVPYFSDAQCPRFEQFMHEIFGGKTDLVAYIQRAIGYSLTGDISEQCFFLCYGNGANGKSTLLNVLKDIAGEYSANTPFNTFEAGRQSGTGQEIVQLRGRRVVLSSETNDGSRLNEARVKAITGGDEVTGRYLYARNTISFVPTFKLWLATNHKPTIKGNDEGIWRRVRLIPFLESFTQDKRDPHLEAKLKQELPGILNWAVRGALAWYRQGLGEPQDVIEATTAYRDESDTFGLFLEETTTKHDMASVSSGELYERYQRWTEASGLGTLSIVKFARAMESHGYEKRRTTANNRWVGLELRPDG